jgi:hypothetical protein
LQWNVHFLGFVPYSFNDARLLDEAAFYSAALVDGPAFVFAVVLGARPSLHQGRPEIEEATLNWGILTSRLKLKLIGAMVKCCECGLLPRLVGLSGELLVFGGDERPLLQPVILRQVWIFGVVFNHLRSKYISTLKSQRQQHRPLFGDSIKFS